MNSRRDPRFDDGTSARSDFRSSGRRIDPRKTAQLCAQICRTLQLTLLGEIHDSALAELEIERVEPTADPGRVRVVCLVPTEASDRLDTIQIRVEAARGVFTSAVAKAINRRRVPDMVFAVQTADVI